MVSVRPDRECSSKMLKSRERDGGRGKEIKKDRGDR